MAKLHFTTDNSPADESLRSICARESRYPVLQEMTSTDEIQNVGGFESHELGLEEVTASDNPTADVSFTNSSDTNHVEDEDASNEDVTQINEDDDPQGPQGRNVMAELACCKTFGKNISHDYSSIMPTMEHSHDRQSQGTENSTQRDFENKRVENQCLRCVTVVSSLDKQDIFISQLEYDALKYIASRFRMHGAIERKKLSGHFAQSDAHVRAAFQNRQGTEDLVSKFPEVFKEEEGWLAMADLGFVDAVNCENQSLETMPIKRTLSETQEVSRYSTDGYRCTVDSEENASQSDQTNVMHEKKTVDSVRKTLGASHESIDVSEGNVQEQLGSSIGTYQTKHHVGDSFSATVQDNTRKMQSTIDVLNERGTLDEDNVLDESSLRYITILDYPASRNILVTQLQYDALKHIATRFKKHGKIEKKKLFGHFAQSDDHVRSEFFSTAGTDNLIAQFPDIFLENEGKLVMVDLSFESSAYPLHELSSFRVSDCGLHEESVTSKGGATECEEGKDHSTSAQSFASHTEFMQDSITFSTHSQSDGSTSGKVENVEALSQWEIEAKAFIASKLVKHKHIFLRNLHSHFDGASKSLIENLHGYEKQREFLLRHSDFFRVDDEDMISLTDPEFSSAWSDSVSSVPHVTSVSSSHSLCREPDRKHGQKANFVGVGKITRLYQRTQGGFVEDMDTAEIIHFRAKTAGLGCTDIADLFKVDDFVAFQAGPREFGVMYPNGILKMKKIDEREAEALQFIIKRLRKVGPISLQNLSGHFSIASEAVRQLVLPMEKLEGFFMKHSLLFNQQGGSDVSLKGHALATKPPSGSDTGDKKLSSGPDSGDKKISSVSDAGDKKPISGVDYGEIKPPNRPGRDQNLSGVSDSGEKKPSNGSDSGDEKPSRGSDSGDKTPSSEVDEKWFKVFIHTQKHKISTYVKKWQFLVLQHVRSALQPLDKVKLSKLHELILQSPGNSNEKPKTADQAHTFVLQYPSIFKLDGDDVSMAKVTFTQRKEALPDHLQTKTSVPKYSEDQPVTSAYSSSKDKKQWMQLSSIPKDISSDDELLTVLVQKLQTVECIKLENITTILKDLPDHTKEQMKTLDQQQLFCKRNNNVVHLENGVIRLALSGKVDSERDSSSYKCGDSVSEVPDCEQSSTAESMHNGSLFSVTSDNKKPTPAAIKTSAPSFGIGVVVSLYPTNGRIQDVFTDEVIHLFGKEVVKGWIKGLDSLEDLLCVGDFVEYDSFERPNAQKYKKGISKLQMIHMEDLECVHAIVKCLREVENMNTDALLVYLNDTGNHMSIHTCSKKAIVDLIKKYDVIFGESENLVKLKFEVSEDAPEWILPRRLSSSSTVDDVTKTSHTVANPLPGTKNLPDTSRTPKWILTGTLPLEHPPVRANDPAKTNNKVAISLPATTEFPGTTLKQHCSPVEDSLEIPLSVGDSLTLPTIKNSIPSHAPMEFPQTSPKVASPFTDGPDKAVVDYLREELLQQPMQEDDVITTKATVMGVFATATVAKDCRRGTTVLILPECFEEISSQGIQMSQMVRPGVQLVLRVFPLPQSTGGEQLDIAQRVQVIIPQNNAICDEIHCASDLTESSDVFLQFVSSDLNKQTRTDEKGKVPGENESEQTEFFVDIKSSKHDTLNPSDLYNSFVVQEDTDDIETLSRKSEAFDHTEDKVFVPHVTRELLDTFSPTNTVGSSGYSWCTCNDNDQLSQKDNTSAANAEDGHPSSYVSAEADKVSKVQDPATHLNPQQEIRAGVPLPIGVQTPDLSLAPDSRRTVDHLASEPNEAQPLDEVDFNWQNQIELKTSLSPLMTEGTGKVCAVLPPFVFVHMQECEVGVFKMAEQQSIIPKLDTQVRYLAQRVESDQARWSISDLFVEHHIISADGSSTERKSVDTEVQTSITGHILGCNIFR